MPADSRDAATMPSRTGGTAARTDGSAIQSVLTTGLAMACTTHQQVITTHLRACHPTTRSISFHRTTTRAGRRSTLPCTRHTHYNFLNHNASTRTQDRGLNHSMSLPMVHTPLREHEDSRHLCLHLQAIPSFRLTVLLHSSPTPAPSRGRRMAQHHRLILRLLRLWVAERNARILPPVICRRPALRLRTMLLTRHTGGAVPCNCLLYTARKHRHPRQHHRSGSLAMSVQSDLNYSLSPRLNSLITILCLSQHQSVYHSGRFRLSIHSRSQHCLLQSPSAQRLAHWRGNSLHHMHFQQYSLR